MDEGRFWEIVAESRSDFDPSLFDGNQQRQAERLREVLEVLPPGEIVEFERHFEQKCLDAYRWDLWGVARLIEGDCSDDSFLDFRYWLISMGRTVYEATLRDPDSLVDVADTPGFEVAGFEEFGSIARQLYEEMTGNEIPRFDRTFPRKPEGERWGDDKLAKNCPRLWEKYGK